jgi:hypothetical protein
MPVHEHIAHVPYEVLVRHFEEAGEWTCVVCGGKVTFRSFGHEPQPRVPLFECEQCGRRSDGCQTFEGHHLLYRYCPLDDGVSMRCGYWQCEWQRARGACPVCGGSKDDAPARKP